MRVVEKRFGEIRREFLGIPYEEFVRGLSRVERELKERYYYRKFKRDGKMVMEMEEKAWDELRRRLMEIFYPKSAEPEVPEEFKYFDMM